jgi:hypothetical protein
MGEPATQPFRCHVCPQSFPTVAALRVHAVVDERRVITPAERAGSAQLSLFMHAPHPNRGARP